MLARVDLDLADPHARQVALETGPRPAPVDRDEQAELGPQEEQVRVDRILTDGQRITVDVLGDQRRPARPVVRRAVDVGCAVAGAMAVEDGKRGTRRMGRGIDAGDPRVGRQVRDVPRHVGPVGAAVARDLDVAVVRADPEDVLVARLLGDAVDRAVVLGRGVVDRQAAGLALALLLGVVGRQVRGDLLPGVTPIPGPEHELPADVDGVVTVGADVHPGVPVEAVLRVALPLERLDVLDLAGGLAHALHAAALPFDVDDVGVSPIDVGVEAVAGTDVVPVLVLHAAVGARRAVPGAVVLQAAVHVVGPLHVEADLVELGDGDRVAERPAASQVVGLVEPAVGTQQQMPGIARVDPQGVMIRVGRVCDRGEDLPSVGRQRRGSTGLVDPVVVLGVDDDQREVKGPPFDRGRVRLALPGLAQVGGTEEPGILGLDRRIHNTGA